jgi:hypothetical protein
MPTVTGELHRPQARFSPVNFTEYPRFLMPANNHRRSAPAKSSAGTVLPSKSTGPACLPLPAPAQASRCVFT